MSENPYKSPEAERREGLAAAVAREPQSLPYRIGTVFYAFGFPVFLYFMAVSVAAAEKIVDIPQPPAELVYFGIICGTLGGVLRLVFRR